MVTRIDEALKLGDQVVVLREERHAGPGRKARPNCWPRTTPSSQTSSSPLWHLPRLGFHPIDGQIALTERTDGDCGAVGYVDPDVERWVLTVGSNREPLSWLDTANLSGDTVAGARHQPVRRHARGAAIHCASCSTRRCRAPRRTPSSDDARRAGGHRDRPEPHRGDPAREGAFRELDLVEPGPHRGPHDQPHLADGAATLFGLLLSHR